MGTRKTDSGLSGAEEKFCQEYVIDFNATRSYRAAYPKTKTAKVAGVQAARLLKKDNIKAQIAKIGKKVTADADINLEELVRELKLIAYGHPRELYDVNGQLLSPHKMNATAGALLNSYTVDPGEYGIKKKWSRTDKLRAIDMLAKLGRFYDSEGNAPDVTIIIE